MGMIERSKTTKRGYELNIKTLFHGTRDTDPMLIASGEIGFDLRRSNGRYYGKGIYAATNFDYSHKYRHCPVERTSFVDISCKKCGGAGKLGGRLWGKNRCKECGGTGSTGRKNRET